VTVTTRSGYAEFLDQKSQGEGDQGFDPLVLHEFLFDFQRALVEWALRKGKAAIFADCGMGKAPMSLAWAENVILRSKRPVLIATPLAVGAQLIREGEKFGIECAQSRDGTVQPWITVTNYERLHHFNAEDFGGMVADESSCIKSFAGVRRKIVTDFMRVMPYRLLCTATAAPNDYVELGTSSEALGYLGHMDMLSRFFTNKDNSSTLRRPGRWSMERDLDGMIRSDGGWRFKGHAEDPFWRWVSSWARAMRKPSDLGFDDGRFYLPLLETRDHVITARAPRDDMLFDLPALGLREERDESRRTITERCEKATELLADADSGVAWCQLNAEGDLLTKLIDGAVQVSGSDSVEVKEERLIAFGRGEIRVLVTKPRIASWGLNWQHCHRMTYFPDHSFEAAYQAVRRCWRFGQEHPVTVDMITTEGGVNALKSQARKAAQADRMFTALVAHMHDTLAIRRAEPYDEEVEIPRWL
jgi:hypothetical protein